MSDPTPAPADEGHDDPVAQMVEAALVFDNTRHGDDLARWAAALRAALERADRAERATHAYMADLIAVTNRAEKAEAAIAALRNGVHRWAASWLANVPTASRRYAELRALLDGQADIGQETT